MRTRSRRYPRNRTRKTIEKDRMKFIPRILNHKTTFIPLYIFQTWHQKRIPPLIFECMENMRKQNPEFRHFIFNEIECRQFIQLYFNNQVLHAYDSLIPKAYKADLWRYCVLYIHGGVYLDAKMRMKKGFRLITLTDKEYFVKDILKDRNHFVYDGAICNGMMICRPFNEKMKRAIGAILENVQRRFYGIDPVSPTGPMMLKELFTPKETDKMEMQLIWYPCPMKGISFLPAIPGNIFCYIDETVYAAQKKHVGYRHLWHKRKIYR
jgi:mannosyltransferase OCH1-like enzyme